MFTMKQADVGNEKTDLDLNSEAEILLMSAQKSS